MTKEDFNDLVQRLRRGDNSALSYIHPLQEKCIRSLVIDSNRRCDREQAYDIFIDSVLDFRKNVLHNTVEYQNIPAYMRQICWNKWLAHSRTNERQRSKHADVTARLYDDTDFEEQLSMEELHEVRLAAVNAAMQTLSEQCKRVLNMAIADEMSMADIAATLNMASSDVAKTTKSRCYKKLLEVIRNSPEL